MERQNAPSATTRTRLAEAAVDIFETYGFEAGKPAQIAERVGVGERTFFRHFPRKELSLFPDHDRLEALFDDHDLATLALKSPFMAFGVGLRRVVAHRAGERDLWRRRYDLIDATGQLRAFDRSLDARIIDRIVSALVFATPLAPTMAGTSMATVRTRSVASMLAVGGAYVLRAATAEEDVDHLVDDLIARAAVAYGGEPPRPAARQDAVVVLVDPDAPADLIGRRVRAALDASPTGRRS